MGEFPGGPVIKTLCFHCLGPGLITVQGTKILQAAQHSQKKKKKKIEGEKRKEKNRQR